MSQSRRLAAIMFVDIAGYTATMQHDESMALDQLHRLKEVLNFQVQEFEGKIIQYYGDGCLIIFNNAVDAVKCAMVLQEDLRNEPKVPLRIGLHLGDFIREDDNIFGDSVNISSRIQTMGVPGAVLLSDAIRNQIKNKPEFQLTSLGKIEFKNVDDPIEVFALSNNGFPVPDKANLSGKFKEIKTLTPVTSFPIENKTSKRSVLSFIAIGAIFSILAGYFIFKHYYPSEKNSIASNTSEFIEKSIAVLPFRNDSPEDSTQYFMDGVMEEILNNLQKIKDLRVISRTSVEQYRKKSITIPEIGRELGVNYIVEGSGQKSGDSIILRVQLVEIRYDREKHLMGSSFRRKLEGTNSFFNIQSTVAQSIASELNAKITSQEKKLIEKLPTDNLEAYEAWLKGQFYLNKFTTNDFDSAMVYFERAKQIDPNYALAYTGISDVWSYRQQKGLVAPAEGNSRSMEAVMKAYALDSNNAVVQYSLAVKKVWGMYDWAGGEEGFKKSILLNPNSAITRAMYSHLLNLTGRPDEALEQIHIALKLDPMNPFIKTFYGVDLYMVRKYDEAIKAFNDALNLSPGYPFALGNLWRAYRAAGRTEEAYSTLKSTWTKFDSQLVNSLEQEYLKYGFNRVQLLLAERLVKLMTNSPNQFVSPLNIARLYCFAKETDKAIYWLEQAYNFRDPNLPYLLSPDYDNIRNDSRYHDLLRRMNLPYRPKL